MNQQNYLERLQKIGVRTDRDIEVMYSDLFLISENAFLKECHATDAFELYDFVKEKVKFKELHELRRHLEDLLIWMYPDGLPAGTRGTNNRFKQLSNPYLEADYEPVRQKAISMKSNQWISAAFNIRCRKPGEQFRRDREILLQKLEDRNFSAAALEEYRTAGKDNSQIPRIGLDLVKQEIYLLGRGESFLPNEVGEERIFAGWQRKYLGIFDRFSDTGLTIYYNKRVDRDNSSPGRRGILESLKDELMRRRIDFTSIGDKRHLEMQQCVVLVDKKMHTIKELPKELVEGMVMMLRKKKKLEKISVNIKEIGEKEIFYLDRGHKCSVNINYMLKFFYRQLVEQA